MMTVRKAAAGVPQPRQGKNALVNVHSKAVVPVLIVAISRER